jgi:hypothetical protein
VDGQGNTNDLVGIMTRLAAGDDAAAVTLCERYGGPIGAAVRRVAWQRGRTLSDDDVAGMVLDVCFELQRVAHRWSPTGGALPWVWARHRVANVVDRVLGPPAEPLDDARLRAIDARAAAVAPPTAGSADGSLLDALGLLVPDLASAHLLAQALDHERISARDRELWLEYAYEKHAGNTSPATTVAPVFGLTEAAVRQAARRARHRVRRLASSDERFAPLADLPLLA